MTTQRTRSKPKMKKTTRLKVKKDTVKDLSVRKGGAVRGGGTGVTAFNDVEKMNMD